MGEGIKNRIILVLSVLLGIFVIATINSCRNEKYQQKGRSQEVIKRMESEENLAAITKTKEALEGKLESTTRDLESEKTAHQAVQKAYDDLKTANQNLTDELQKMTKLKEKLEEDLKEILAKTAKSKK